MRIVKLVCILTLVLATILNAQKWQKIEMKFTPSDSLFRVANNIVFATKSTGWFSIYCSDIARPPSQHYTKIFKTTNGGYNWFVQKIMENDISDYNLFTTDSLHCWIYTSEGKLLYTIDGGTNWEETYIDPNPTEHLYLFRNLYFFNSEEGIVLKYPSRPWFTKDGGKSWTAGDSSKVYFYGGDISFINREKGWIVSELTPYGSDVGYIANTTDGGKTWRYQDSVTHKVSGVDFVDSLYGFAVGANWNNSSGYIFSTSDGGKNWQVIQILYSGAFWDVGFLDNKNGWITGDGKILNTTDGGITWETQFIDSSSCFHKLILLKEKKTAYIFGEDYLYGPPFTLFFANLGNITKAEENKGSIPKEFQLMQNYPNPFNPGTEITYKILEDGFVNITVYNTIGQEVAVLVNQYQAAGKHIIQFKAEYLPSGVYIYKLKSGRFSDVKKMLLTK